MLPMLARDSSASSMARTSLASLGCSTKLVPTMFLNPAVRLWRKSVMVSPSPGTCWFGTVPRSTAILPVSPSTTTFGRGLTSANTRPAEAAGCLSGRASPKGTQPPTPIENDPPSTSRANRRPEILVFMVADLAGTT